MSQGGEELLGRYRALPYSRVIEKVMDEEGTYYICRYPELPGLAADGETRSQAIKNGQDAFDDYIRARLQWEDGAIPEPPGAARILRELDTTDLQAVSSPHVAVFEILTVVAPEQQRQMAMAMERGGLPATNSAAARHVERVETATAVGVESSF